MDYPEEKEQDVDWTGFREEPIILVEPKVHDNLDEDPQLDWISEKFNMAAKVKTGTLFETKLSKSLKENRKNIKVAPTAKKMTRKIDYVNHPPHYTDHPSGIECIEITRHMGFNLGNVVKYAWRCDLKQDAIEDLEKARFYLDDEIQKRKDMLVSKDI